MKMTYNTRHRYINTVAKRILIIMMVHRENDYDDKIVEKAGHHPII